MNIEQQTYYIYAQDVIDNKIVTNNYIRLACERFFKLLDNDKYYFNIDAVDKVINFISIIKHYLGKHANKPFILQPWQTFIIACVYGFFRKDTGKRLCRNVFILMSRKQGKSALAAALSLYHLIADNEQAGEIFFAANSREQAKILLNITSNFAKSLDPKLKSLEIYRDTIKFKALNSFIKVVSADTSKLDGYNLSFAVIDEEHEAKNSKMIDVISSSMGMREQPLLLEISTAGFNLFGVCKEKFDTCTEILQGVKEDDSLMCFLYTLDDKDKWDDPTVWIKSNPNLGITVTKDYIEQEVNKAKNTPSLEVSVKTKNLNMWCSSSEVWIPNTYILQSTKTLNINDFKGCSCYVGVDLSSVSDLTAVSYMIVKSDNYYFYNKYYLPESALDGNSNSELYKKWKRLGYITITSGNVTDYDYITNDLMKMNNVLLIQSIAYDSWNSTQWAIDATSKGLPLQPFAQNIGNYNRPTKEFERLILQGDKVIIDNNEITRYCFQNVKLKFDYNDNCKPIKSIAQQKIDGVIAMLTALGYYLTVPHYNYDVI